jgi:very-short-patch-repair endonuclease
VVALSLAVRDQLQPRQRQVASLARRQYGVVAHRQLVRMGFRPAAIGRWVAGGWLHPLHRGVYAVGHPVIARSGRWMAAVLACGPTAVLSHRDAAALWGIRRSSRRDIDVTVARRGRRALDGITLHSVRELWEDDRGVMEGIPVTSLARALLDLAEVVRPRELERAFEEAERLRILDVAAIESLLARSRGRRGEKPLGRLVRDYAGEPPPTRSEFERIFVDLCDAEGIRRPRVNSIVEGYEVDAAWVEQKLLVELDSREFHDNDKAFETDRVRDAVLQLAEYRVLRVTWRRLRREPHIVAGLLRRGLATR